MTVWLTSDLHLGHPFASEVRGFSSIEEHDSTIIENLRSVVTKRDKLFVLGDVAWKNSHLKLMAKVPGQKEMIFGNHDKMMAQEYLKYFHKLHGFRRYKNFWLSHCPIHPQEIYRCKGNIHGHIHNGGGTKELYKPYYCVNTDFHNFHPVKFETIEEIFNDSKT